MSRELGGVARASGRKRWLPEWPRPCKRLICPTDRLPVRLCQDGAQNTGKSSARAQRVETGQRLWRGRRLWPLARATREVAPERQGDY